MPYDNPKSAPSVSSSSALPIHFAVLLILVSGCLSRPLPLTLEEQRAENLRVYEREVARSAVADSSYIAIAQGRFLGASASIEEAQALIRAQPLHARGGDIRHAFLYQQGQSGDRDYEVYVPYQRWDIMGMGALFAGEINWTFAGRPPDVRTVLIHEDRRVEYPFELGVSHATIHLQPASSMAEPVPVKVLVSTGVSAALILTHDTARKLGLETAEIPGTAHLDQQFMRDGMVLCRRALVVLTIPEIDVRMVVEAVCLPEIP